MKRIWQALLLAAVAIIAVLLIGHCVENRLGEARFANWGSWLTGIGSVLFALTALITGLLAVKEYGNRVSTAKARWLFELFEKFYEKPSYKEIRGMIDYDNMEAIVGAIRKDEAKDGVFSAEQKNLFDKFTDYLNFFEMVAYWKSRRQLDQGDIDAMFEYYLKRLIEVDKGKEIRNYLEKEGFENLSRLLLEYEER